MRKLGRRLFLATLWLLLFILTIWAVGALYFAFPITALRAPIAIVYALALAAIFIFVKGRGRAAGMIVGGFIVVLMWWLTLQPRNDRAWEPDVARTAFAQINGDKVTVQNIRNFGYRTETDYIPHWETRTVRLSSMTGIDFFLIYWGSPWVAHTIVSFTFADEPPIAFSIETRKEIGEEYSTLAGFFRCYELIYIVADERDVVRVRTNYRKDEEVYLFHMKVRPERAREIFLDYLRSLNALHARAEFYNAITSNCTTNIRIHVAGTAHGRARPWDWRILLNGKIDEYVYELGAVDRTFPFRELKRRSLINPIARAAGDSPDFSERIRAGLPGFPSR